MTELTTTLSIDDADLIGDGIDAWDAAGRELDVPPPGTPGMKR
jgi:hypothetical protein